MERLFISITDETIKVRKAHSGDAWTKPMVWKDLEFQLTTSPIMMMGWPIILPELKAKTARSLVDLLGARYPFSPYYEQVKKLCPEITFTKTLSEWVFFGGSFNPWHKGHQACLDLLPEDKVCFILPDRSPHKEMNQGDPVVSVIELVRKIKFHRLHFFAPTFLMDFEKNPTVNWIEKLRKDYPSKKLSLLIGFDALNEILKWTRAVDLLKSLDTLYVASRLESDDERKAAADPVKMKAPNLSIEFLGHHAFEDLSSTQFRK